MDATEPTLIPGQEIKLTVLSACQPPVSGRVRERTGTQLRLSLDTRVPSAAPVKIAGPDLLLLGDVYRCEPEDGGFAVSVTTRYVLSELARLSALNKMLTELDESQKPAPVLSR